MIKEEIIVLPNTNKLPISLAYKNKNVFNIRFFTPIELAREVLLRNSKVCNKEYVSREEELVYYKSIIDNIDYFKSTKLEDIKKINNAINSIRKLAITNEDEELKNNLSKGIFKEKNDSLYELYKTYINKLESENKIDTIGLIRYALTSSLKINTKVKMLEEYPLQPLELELVKSAAEYEKSSLFDLYEVQKIKTPHVESMKNCYGSSNEVASIIDDVFSNNIADQCVVACSDYATYSQVFYDYANKYELNITFGNGLSLVNSYPGKLLKQYYYWMSDGNFGWEPFMKLIHSPYFDFDKLNSLVSFDTDTKDYQDVPRFWQRVSRLRLTNNKEENDQTIKDFEESIKNDINDNKKLHKYVPSIKNLANEFSLPMEEFLTKYYVTRKDNDNEYVIHFDESAQDTIVNNIRSVRNIGLDITSDVIEDILRRPIYKQGNKPKHLHVCSIDSALSSLRDNLYICGLSSTLYPGTPKENPLLLDDDLQAFNNTELTSKGKIETKKEMLNTLINLASALNNKIYLSYAGLNVSELKNNNASSMLFEIYKKEKGSEKSLDEFAEYVKKVEYFEPKLSVSKDIGSFYNKDAVIKLANDIVKNETRTSVSLNKYSPSALNTFFDCKKKFYFQNILKISSPDPYNPYEIIPANEQGTLVHSLMEYLADYKPDLDKFLEFGEKAFDEYMKITVPLVKEEIKRTKEQFLEMLTNGWHMDNENIREVAFKEEDKSTLHDESGITIHGYPDRVEKMENGKAVIIDFKTEKDLNKHKTDDVDSCLQVLIYAYIVEKEMNLEIDHCEFRMLRFKNGIIKCKYDQETKDKMAEKLKEFKHAIDTANFDIDPMTEKEANDKCKYCKFASICEREVTKDE